MAARGNSLFLIGQISTREKLNFHQHRYLVYENIKHPKKILKLVQTSSQTNPLILKMCIDVTKNVCLPQILSAQTNQCLAHLAKCHIAFFHQLASVMVVIVLLLDLQLPMQSVPITTNNVSLNPTHDEVYSIQHCDKVCQWLAIGHWFFSGYSGFLHQ